MKKTARFLFFIFLFVILYVVIIKKDENLKLIPKNTDAFLLIDTKNVIKTYIYQYIIHPEKWMESKPETNQISWKNAGLKLPDYFQIFHLENTPLHQWHCILEIKNKEKLRLFLDSRKYQKTDENSYFSEEISIQIENDLCVITFGKILSKESLRDMTALLPKNLKGANWNSHLKASDYTKGGHGSISIIDKEKASSIPFKLSENRILFNWKNEEKHLSTIQKLASESNDFLLSLDQSTISDFNKKLFKIPSDSLQFQSFYGAARIIMTKDSIVTYEYDENFNEIAKTSFQEIAKPIFSLKAKAANAENFIQYSKNQKWLNDKNEWTKIPFSPNQLTVKDNEIELNSLPENLVINTPINGNFLFIHHFNEFSTKITEISKANKKRFTKIQHIYWGRTNNEDFIEISFEKSKYPIILQL